MIKTLSRGAAQWHEIDTRQQNLKLHQMREEKHVWGFESTACRKTVGARGRNRTGTPRGGGF